MVETLGRPPSGNTTCRSQSRHAMPQATEQNHPCQSSIQSTVRVVVRIRPLSMIEQDQGCRCLVYPKPDTSDSSSQQQVHASQELQMHDHDEEDKQQTQQINQEPHSRRDFSEDKVKPTKEIDDDTETQSTIGSLQSTVSLDSTGSHTKASSDFSLRRQVAQALQIDEDIHDNVNNEENKKSDFVDGNSHDSQGKYFLDRRIKPFSKRVVVETARYHRQFDFDAVFSDETSQDEIYRSAVGDIVNQVFLGYNATIIAYGQTGSG